MTNARTISALGEAVENELDDKYTLVYTNHGDTLSDDVVAALVTGSNECDTKGGEALMEWASDVQWSSACDVVDTLTEEIIHRWEGHDNADYQHLLDVDWASSSERESAIFTVQERDGSTWFTDLVNQYGAVLLRVPIASMNEDAGLSFQPLTSQQFLDLLGFPHSEKNVELANEVIDNSSPQFSAAIGQALVGVDLTDVVNLPAEGKVELRNPHVWLGNPFMGSGWCSEDAFDGTLVVDRTDLRTDKDAFGYPWNEVVGGTHASYYSGEIAAATTVSSR